MSNKLVKKLQNISTLPVPCIDKEESDSSSGEEKSVNKYTALLTDLPAESDLSGTIVSSSGTLDDDHDHKKKSKQNSKRRRKKKKSNIKNKETEKQEDEIDRCVREVNELLGEVNPVKILEDEISMEEKEQEALLSVSKKYLDPLFEMKRIFGAQVVENKMAQKRNNGDRHAQGCRSKRCVIIGGKAPYPDGVNTAISMEVDNESEGCVYFKFVHLPGYQQIQLKFRNLVNATLFDPEAIMSFLIENPVHIDTLLTAAEVHRLADESSVANKLIERAIYVMEDAFLPQFNYSSGKCRMNYRQQENRAFFILIFRYIMNMEDRGCTRTALELCKLLLNLSPDADPLGASLMLDYYAIRAKEYAWLVSLYDSYESVKNLSMLPNFSFSVPLALYYLSEQKSQTRNKNIPQYKVLSLTTDELRKRADRMLQEALLMFPSTLSLLLDKCSVTADKDVIKHPYFGPQAQISMTKGLRAIICLFVGRNFILWKQPDVMLWLEENVKTTMERIDKMDPLIPRCEEQRKIRYVGTPNPIYRHILIAEIKDVTIALPDEFAEMAVMSHDPLPPPDSICGYKSTKQSTTHNAENVMTSFFRSIMPNYNPNRPMRAEDETENGEEDGGGSQIRESVQTIIDGLRNLAATIRRDNPEGDDEQNNHPDQQ